MNNKTKIIIIALPLVLFAMKGIAQSANGDLWNALYWSQKAANNGGDDAAGFAAHAFDGGGHYYGSGSSHSYGSTVTPAQPGRRTATNMSNVGLKISSSGYNRGAELARYYAEQRAERARLKAERDERMVNSYMQMHYENSKPREASWLMYIDNNSHAKPFSQEEIYRFISNGLPGNVIIDDDGMMNMSPEVLLEGSGGKLETLEERLEHMSNEEIDGLAEELNQRMENGEELSDEELDFLIAQKKERVARLEEQKRFLEETISKRIEEFNNTLDINF